MRKNFFKILLLALMLFFSACPGEDDSGGLDILSSDQTQEAVDLVLQANTKLSEIKRILHENEILLEDLKKAMGEKNQQKVKEICDEILHQISTGMKIGEDAVKLIDQAASLKINDDFRNYLNLKTQSLAKYSEAYKERFELAKTLRDEYDPKNTEKRKFVSEEFQRREETFMKIMKEAGALSERANLLAKEANSRKKE